jgi:hypothetical protein
VAAGIGPNKYIGMHERKIGIGGGAKGLRLTFFSAGSVTVSASLLSALRICEAATLVDVFSKACKIVC